MLCFKLCPNLSTLFSIINITLFSTINIIKSCFFRAIMQDVSSDNRVLSLVSRSGIRNTLVTLLDQLQRCQKSLNEFLEVTLFRNSLLHKCRHLTKTLHFTLSEDYSHPDDYTRQINYFVTLTFFKEKFRLESNFKMPRASLFVCFSCLG